MKKYMVKRRQKPSRIWITVGIVIIVGLIGGFIAANNTPAPIKSQATELNSYKTIEEIPVVSTLDDEQEPDPVYFDVISVVDGDTIKINYGGTTTSVRLIGVNTPETVDPRTTVECFGKEASSYLTSLLSGKRVTIEADPTQTDRDKYNRLLRYVYLDGEDVGYQIIANGYGYEFTYNVPYQKQSAYKSAQTAASSTGKGLWSENTCNGSKDTATGTATPSSASTANCTIKGNISDSGEKIYHVPGQKYYDTTKIDTSKGERYFCTEQDAKDAGWRKAKV